jgi:hypothetical protein
MKLTGTALLVILAFNLLAAWLVAEAQAACKVDRMRIILKNVVEAGDLLNREEYLDDRLKCPLT